MSYLLDSNICIAYLRGKNALIQQRLAKKPPNEISLCSVVMAELYIGALRSSNPTSNRASIDHFANVYSSLAFDDATADQQAIVRHQLEAAGTPIGPYDLQIAAIALVNQCILVTHNTREFGRVPGLSIEDWELP